MPLFTPFVPYHVSAGQNEIKKFGGLLTTEWLPPLPGRSFRLRQTYRKTIDGPIPENLRKLINSPGRPKGPPTHFHQWQTEYFTVEHGVCAVEIDGKVTKLTPADGEVSVKPGHIHAFWLDDETPDYMTVILSATDSGKDYQLDRVFFENWYGYWHDALLYEGGLDLIQTLCTHDAGDHYTPAPKWVPFRRFFGYWGCVIIGRWLGGMLGYKPFFKEYTTDWDYAVEKMNGSFWQRRLADKSYTHRTTWDRQVELSQGPDPRNAEYQDMVTDLAETRDPSSKIETAGLPIPVAGPEGPFWGKVALNGTRVDSVSGISSGFEVNGTGKAAALSQRREHS
nr:putative epoxidase protein [Neofusicoccum parvum]